MRKGNHHFLCFAFCIILDHHLHHSAIGLGIRNPVTQKYPGIFVFECLTVDTLNDLSLFKLSACFGRGALLDVGDEHGKVGFAQLKSDTHGTKPLDCSAGCLRVGIHMKLRVSLIIAIRCHQVENH